jgi:thymidylate synthase (FAD)
MRIIEPSFEILTPWGSLSEQAGIQLLQFIERMARISHRSEDKQTADSWKRFIQAVVLEHGDWSVVEHASLTVIFRVDRGVTHELVRHRLFSFTQESTRFVKYGKSELEFIQPARIEEGGHVYSNIPTWQRAIAVSEQAYLELLRNGVRPQEARSVLPNALAATIAVTGNLRSWRWLLLARTTKETHPDFKRVTIPLLADFQKNIPLLFNDIVPEQKQSLAFARPH